MSSTELILLVVLICVPIITLVLVTLAKKNKDKMDTKAKQAKEKERVKNLTDEQKEIEALKKKIEFDKKYEQMQAEKAKTASENAENPISADISPKDDRPEMPARRVVSPSSRRPPRSMPSIMDDEFFDDINNADSVADEIHNMSPTMKAIVFGDLLKPKE